MLSVNILRAAVELEAVEVLEELAEGEGLYFMNRSDSCSDGWAPAPKLAP